MSGPGKVMVELREVSKGFGGVKAVRAVDLQVRDGEFLTLLGPSGCGKSTLLRLVAGLALPDQGEIFLDGAEVTQEPPYRRDANMVFQSYALFPHLTLQDNVGFGLKMKKVPRPEREERVRAALELTSLKGLEKRRPGELSGGQKQRVALARAIVCRPKVLLLDEPLSALDARLRQNMREELKRLQQKLGITFIFVTHDQEEALVLSDRMVVMNAGRIEQAGTPAEIYHRPASAFVAKFVGEANLLEGKVSEVTPGGFCFVGTGGLRIPVRNGGVWKEGGRVILALRPEKIDVLEDGVPVEETFSAVVEEVGFLGAGSRLLLRDEKGLAWKVLLSDGRSPQPGDRLKCRIRPEEWIVLQSPD